LAKIDGTDYNTQWVTGGGGGTPGGSDSQIQYNNSGAFAGNVAMTFDDVTGNINFGNLQIVGTNVITSVNSYTSNVTPNPGRINVGSGKNGDYSNTADIGLNARGARMWIVDEYVKPDNGLRSRELVVSGYANLAGGNIGTANSNTRLSAASFEQYVINGNSLSTVAFAVTGISTSIVVGQGANVGQANLTGGIAQQGFLQVNSGSTATTLHLNAYTTNFNGNVTNFAGYSGTLGGTGAFVTGNVTTFYHPGPTATTYPFISTGNIVRNSTNYYSFRSDDDLAKSRLGMLERFHELNANTANTTGTVDISKNNGQVQTIYPTGNVTIGTLSNFVTRVQQPNGTQVNTADTVTLVIHQGATPYTVTMPTGNAQIRYASGISTVGATANTTSMISITGTYNYQTSANQYLITISPEFS
jgi:hypothetical protein